MWYVVQSTGGVSALTLQRLLGFGSYQTAWAWLHKLRRAMEPTSGKLRGHVEVDEVFIGGVEEGVKGRETLTKAKVVIAVERRGQRMAAGRVRMRRIENFNTDTLIGFIKEVVEPGSVVVTDGLGQYRCLPRHGYVHQRHVIKGSGMKAHELMPAVHRVSALVKRWLLGTHQGAVKATHLDFYLAEWSFRFNRRRSDHRGLLLHSLVKQAAHTPPHPYTKLLSPGVGSRRVRKQREDRDRRAVGDLKPARNKPRLAPKRPGGSRTRLSDEAQRRRRRMVACRRGSRSAGSASAPLALRDTTARRGR